MIRKSLLLIGLLSFILPLVTYSQVNTASRLYQRGPKNTRNYQAIAKALMKDGLYYAAVPFLKEYLSNYAVGAEMDTLLDEAATYVGVKLFEILPVNVLSKSKAPALKYILAKKYFRLGQYTQALRSLNMTVPRYHSVKPYALLLEASIYSLQNRQKEAKAVFNECIEITEAVMKRESNPDKLKQLEINRDYCTIGIPRADFTAGNFSSARQTYSKLDKRSYIWPEILFEEAWVSFYMRDFNTALGKLVTYNMPVMNWYFNPEVYILRALSYMELCLWSDVNKVTEEFYKKYEALTKGLTQFLNKNKKNYRFYFNFTYALQNGRANPNELINNLFSSIFKDMAFIELNESYKQGLIELKRVKDTFRTSAFKRALQTNIEMTLQAQKEILGSYIRNGLLMYKDQMDKAFEGMSYIRLEALANRREQILETGQTRARGDIRELQRDSEHLFWTFDREFWADEIGDYVFMLKSECRK